MLKAAKSFTLYKFLKEGSQPKDFHLQKFWYKLPKHYQQLRDYFNTDDNIDDRGNLVGRINMQTFISIPMNSKVMGKSKHIYICYGTNLEVLFNDMIMFDPNILKTLDDEAYESYKKEQYELFKKIVLKGFEEVVCPLLKQDFSVLQHHIIPSFCGNDYVHITLLPILFYLVLTNPTESLFPSYTCQEFLFSVNRFKDFFLTSETRTFGVHIGYEYIFNTHFMQERLIYCDKFSGEEISEDMESEEEESEEKEGKEEVDNSDCFLSIGCNKLIDVSVFVSSYNKKGKKNEIEETRTKKKKAYALLKSKGQEQIVLKDLNSGKMYMPYKGAIMDAYKANLTGRKLKKNKKS